MEHIKKHFHTFDALRFISFLFVFLHHLPFSKNTFLYFFSKSGGIGVSFFFVLSGFLITYILLFEKNTTGSIRLKNYFVRRILRIWPLFYAMIIFAYISPSILNLLGLSPSYNGYIPNWVTTVLFLENYKMMITNSFPDFAPLRVMWSLCVEEHFYIVWGVLLYWISIRKIPILIGICIAIANISRIVYINLGIETLDIFSNIDYFAIGAIPAYILINKPIILKYFEDISLFFKNLITLLVFSLIIIAPNINSIWILYLSPTFFAFLFGLIIVFTITKDKPLYINDKAWFSKLGIFTYGLYLIHTIVINFVLKLTSIFSFQMNMIIIGFVSLIFTIVFSIFSYHLFEKQFLKFKKYFR